MMIVCILYIALEYGDSPPMSYNQFYMMVEILPSGSQDNDKRNLLDYHPNMKVLLVIY